MGHSYNSVSMTCDDTVLTGIGTVSGSEIDDGSTVYMEGLRREGAQKKTSQSTKKKKRKNKSEAHG